MEIFALPLVTLTPSAFARATISIRFLEETACAILYLVSTWPSGGLSSSNSLCCVGLVVHKEKVEIAGVVDKESLVAGGHHVAGLPVAPVSDLTIVISSAKFLRIHNSSPSFRSQAQSFISTTPKSS